MTLYELLICHLLDTNEDTRFGSFDTASAEAAAQGIEDDGRLLEYLKGVSV